MWLDFTQVLAARESTNSGAPIPEMAQQEFWICPCEITDGSIAKALEFLAGHGARPLAARRKCGGPPAQGKFQDSCLRDPVRPAPEVSSGAALAPSSPRPDEQTNERRNRLR